MNTRLLWAWLLCCLMVARALAMVSVDISASPNPVTGNSGFTISASGSDDFGQITGLTVYGPGGYVGSAYPDPWYRSSVWGSWGQTAPASGPLSYTAILDTDNYSVSASTSVTVTPANRAPTIQWVTNPGSVAINQNFTVQAKGMDQDGNLTQVFVWREWSPFAFNGGGNGYENTSDGNTYAYGSVGSVTFQAQATDRNGATSPVISWTVYVYNNAPAVSWHTAQGSAYVNQYFIMRAQGQDSDGNLAWVNVWRDATPFAFNGGGNGYSNVTDANGYTGTLRTSVRFEAQAGDSANASSNKISYDVSILNRPPDSPAITPSGPVTLINANNYYMWLGDTLTLTSTVRDPDGNLTQHGNYYQKVTGATPTGSWTLIGNATPSNGANSTKSTSFTPPLSGRWDFNIFATDGYENTGNSITVYVYGPVNGATFVSQSASTANMATGSTRTVSVTFKNTGDKPWTTDSTPHLLGTQNPDNNMNWGMNRVGSDCR